MSKRLANVILDPLSRILKKATGAATSKSDKIDQDVLKEYQENVRKILEDFEYDGHPWRIGTIDPQSQLRHLNGVEWIPEHIDKEDIRSFYLKKHSLKFRPKLNTVKEVKIFQDAKYYLGHSEVGNHGMAFQRCAVKDCARCVKKHQQHPVPERFFEEMGLPTRKNKILFYVPEKRDAESSHYKTFIEMNEEMKANPTKEFIRDQDLIDKGYGVCVDGCLISFKSKV